MNKGQVFFFLEKEEREAERRRFVPAVRRGCICPGGGKRDERGVTHISPSCLIHGLHMPHVIRGDDGVPCIWQDWNPQHPSTHGSTTEASLAGAIADTARRIQQQSIERTLTMNSEQFRRATEASNRPVPELDHADPFPGTTHGIPTIDTAKVAPTSGPCAADNLPMPEVNGEPIVKPGESLPEVHE